MIGALEHTVNAYAVDTARVVKASYLVLQSLEGKYAAVDFHAAGGRAGAAAEERAAKQYDDAQRWPQSGVGCGESRGRADGYGLETGQAQGLREAVTVKAERYADQQTGKGEESEVGPRDLVAQQTAVVALCEREEDQTQVHSGKEHCHCEHHLRRRILETGYAGVAVAESAGRAGRHCVGDGIEPAEAAYPQGYAG